MGVARDFGPWALNAREFRRAGLNPRVWLGRRVNQSATDAVGGVAIFCVKRRDPLPAGRPRHFAGHRGPIPAGRPRHFAGQRGPPLFHGPPLSGGSDPSPNIPSARTPSLYCRGPPLPTAPRPVPIIPSSVGADPLSPPPRTLSHHSRGPPPSVGADPLSSTVPLSPVARTPPHHSAVRRCGSPLFHGPPPSIGADPLSSTDPSPPFRRPSVRIPSCHRRGPPSLYCRGPLPTIPSSVGADPISPKDPPLASSADPFSPLPLSQSDKGCASFAAHGGRGARLAGRRENSAQNGARGEILSPFSLGGGGMMACKI
ncbi:hypothetical protein niasHT_037579 [Heterodera trifolii]|uniref:Uncharacterized protein n=1 Tax=Heterodera trifolii TaxID=157864 RepID=A0ABD2I2I6_9BILA